MVPTRTCRACGADYPATPEFFYVRPGGKLRTDCKVCVRAAKAARDKADPGHRRAVARKSYHRLEGDGLKKGVAAKLRARKANPELYKQIAERYENKHLAERKERRMELHWLGREENNAKSQAWYYANRDRAIETARAWQKANPELHRANVETVRTRRRQAPGAGVSGPEFRALVEAYGGLCAYCADPLGDDYEMDHVVALGLGRGGHHAIGNVVPACRPCNRAKATKTVDTWLEILLSEDLASKIHPLALHVLEENASSATWHRVIAVREPPSE